MSSRSKCANSANQYLHDALKELEGNVGSGSSQGQGPSQTISKFRRVLREQHWYVDSGVTASKMKFVGRWMAGKIQKIMDSAPPRAPSSQSSSSAVPGYGAAAPSQMPGSPAERAKVKRRRKKPQKRSAPNDPDPPASQPSPARRAKRDYMPKRSGCAWAFLVYMFEKYQEGVKVFRKQELVDGANKYSETPIEDKNGYYDGWSCMSSGKSGLIGRGIVIGYSNPKKLKLSETGLVTAEKCYRQFLDGGGADNDPENFVGPSFSQPQSLSPAAPPKKRRKKASAKPSSVPSSYSPMQSQSSSMPYSSSSSSMPSSSMPSSSMPYSSVPFSLSSSSVQPLSSSFPYNSSAQFPSSSSSSLATYTSVPSSAAVPSSSSSSARQSSSFAVPSSSAMPSTSSSSSANPFGRSDSSGLFVGSEPSPMKISKFSGDLAGCEVVLLLDKREGHATGRCRGNDHNYFREQLESARITLEERVIALGDMMWVLRQKNAPRMEDHSDEIVLNLIVERKKASDLGKSIKDGRYEEQKFRLGKCGLTRIIYIIESPLWQQDDASETALRQALATTECISQFQVHCTKNLKSTICYLASLTHNLTETLRRKQRDDIPIEGPKYSEFNAKVRKNLRVTSRVLFGRQLQGIRGVGDDKALAIVQLYPTPIKLFEAYERCDSESEEIKLLENVLYGPSKRRIGPATSSAIYKFFRMKKYPLPGDRPPPEIALSQGSAAPSRPRNQGVPASQSSNQRAQARNPGVPASQDSYLGNYVPAPHLYGGLGVGNSRSSAISLI
eukprot:838018_1